MSCFKGRMKEYGSISLDRFDGLNLLSTSFFLSHCHTDHMVGLDSHQFSSHLRSNSYKLYCHPVTKILLLSDQRFRQLQPFIVELEPRIPHIISLPPRSHSQHNPFLGNQPGSSPPKDLSASCEPPSDASLERTLTVTLINAGHCPGSVMFFFEGDEGKVLYTGDFRFSPKDFPGMKPLHYSNGSLKPIRTVYYDSTFCVGDCTYIPSRSETFDALIRTVARWLTPEEKSWTKSICTSKSMKAKIDFRSSRRILLFVAAKYGHECLIIALGRHFGLKVHVTAAKFLIYSQIGELRNHVTLDPQESPLHACAYWESETEDKKKTGGRRGMRSIPCCPEASAWDPEVLTIKSSMMWFALLPSSDQKKVCIFDHRSGLQRILYSCHSSLWEVKEFLKFLNPQRAYPNVAPNRSSLAKGILYKIT